MRLFCALLLLGAAVAHCQSPADEVAASERAFAAMSRSTGVRSAFLQWLAPGCVMFAPGPVDGRELYRSRPEKKFFLDWRPTFVLVSSSGDLGITSGPWELSASPNDTPSAVGHFFSVWQKKKEGWRVVFDNGVSYPSDVRRTERVRLMTMPAVQPGKIGKGKQTVSTAEEQFTAVLRQEGIESAYFHSAAEGMRVYRPRMFPSADADAVTAAIRSTADIRTITAMGTESSAAEDLGFVYGIGLTAAGDSASFMRVWQRNDEGMWKIAVDMLDPFPR